MGWDTRRAGVGGGGAHGAVRFRGQQAPGAPHPGLFRGVGRLRGVILALQLLGQGGLSLENGVVFTGFDARLLLVSAVLCCAGLSLVFGRTARHGGTRRDLASVQLTLGERSVQLTALVDTGNTLTDRPTAGRSLVAEGRALAPLLPPGADPADPVGSMERLGRCGLRLLPYRAVGWRAACCWPSGWIAGSSAGTASGGCWWQCPPRRSPTGAAIRH